MTYTLYDRLDGLYTTKDGKGYKLVVSLGCYWSLVISLRCHWSLVASRFIIEPGEDFLRTGALNS